MDLLFLGTGAGVPAKERNVSSIALQLLEERGSTWLFDCGEATQHQILHTAIRPRRIEKIFITHLHGDHIFGLPGLLGSRSFQGGETLITVYGPAGLKEYIETSLRISTTNLRYPIEIVEIQEGIIFEDNRFQVIARKLEHGITTFGYRIVEKDLPGKLLIDNLKEQGIEAGPIFKKIKDGQTVVLDDGREINGLDYIGPPIKGRVVTILGDTRMCRSSLELAKSADILVHEATFSGDESEMAHSYFHSTTLQAAEIAVKANVKTLILTHISSRYQGEDSQRLLEEASRVFPNTFIANDFMKHIVQRKE